MRRKTLVSIPINGDYQKQLDFENEKRLIKYHDFHTDTIDIIKTLKKNRITNRKSDYLGMYRDGPDGYGARFFDHCYFASDDSGKYYFITEPYLGTPTSTHMFNGEIYCLYEETVASVAQWCRKNGLNLEIRLDGPHCKDTPTTMFIISGNN